MEPTPAPSRIRFIARFVAVQADGAGPLVAATVLALVWANSPFRSSYESLAHDAHAVVNEGLMAIFFLVVGLEVKRELVLGELRDRRRATLPAIAAVGGMVLPALLYLAVAGGRGWGVPMATDIAFALGVLALAGPRVPAPLKTFLLTLAVVDDIGAVLVIAVVYSESVDLAALAAAVALLGVMIALRVLRLRSVAPQLVLGAGLWYALHESGVHATLAGVVTGLVIAADRAEELEHRLNPVSSLVVVPVFALVNAGVPFEAAALGERVAWGVVVGLVVGKVLGITGAAWLAARAGLGSLPTGVEWRHIAGAGFVAGVGFTVSIFVADLAFADPATAKVGILVGSAAAAAGGLAWLHRS